MHQQLSLQCMGIACTCIPGLGFMFDLDLWGATSLNDIFVNFFKAFFSRFCFMYVQIHLICFYLSVCFVFTPTPYRPFQIDPLG